MNAETRETKKNLPVPLTEAEIISKHQRRSELAAALKETKAARKEIRLELAREQKNLNAELKSITAVLEAGAEERLVDCLTTYDYSRGLVIIERLDTGAIVEERAMLPAERQGGLNLQEPGEGGPEAGEEPEAEAAAG